MTYTPGRLLDYVMRLASLRTDAELSRFIDIQTSRVSEIRSGNRVLGAKFLIDVHELTGIPVRELKMLAGLKSKQQKVIKLCP